MHELSLAINLVVIAQEEGERLKSAIQVVHVRVGPLSGVVKEALLSAWDEASRDTSLQGSRLVIEDVPLVVYCPHCREEHTLASPQLLKCPVCDARTPKIISGRELQMVGLEVDDE